MRKEEFEVVVNNIANGNTRSFDEEESNIEVLPQQDGGTSILVGSRSFCGLNRNKYCDNGHDYCHNDYDYDYDDGTGFSLLSGTSIYSCFSDEEADEPEIFLLDIVDYEEASIKYTLPIQQRDDNTDDNNNNISNNNNNERERHGNKRRRPFIMTKRCIPGRQTCFLGICWCIAIMSLGLMVIFYIFARATTTTKSNNNDSVSALSSSSSNDSGLSWDISGQTPQPQQGAGGEGEGEGEGEGVNSNSHDNNNINDPAATQIIDDSSVEQTDSGPIRQEGKEGAETPEALEGRLALLLNRYTQWDILKDNTTPQGQAFQRLLQEELLKTAKSTDKTATASAAEKTSDFRFIQRYILMTLYYSTKPEQWINRDGWDDHNDQTPYDNNNECGWYGISACRTITDSGDGDNIDEQGNEEKAVIGIDLTANALTSTLPTELCYLEYLEEIIMGDNNLKGIVPKCITKLTNLRRLSLNNNRLTRFLPRGLLIMPNIEVVDLNGNILTGTLDVLVDGYQETTATTSDDGLPLRIFRANNNFIVGEIPKEFAKFVNLETLVLSDNALTGTIDQSMCSYFPNLNEFEVDCHLVDCECCTNCKNNLL